MDYSLKEFLVNNEPKKLRIKGKLVHRRAPDFIYMFFYPQKKNQIIMFSNRKAGPFSLRISGNGILIN